jgi:hypothetical protein
MTGRTRSTTDIDLVKVAHANDEAEAELLQGLLRQLRCAHGRSELRVE